MILRMTFDFPIDFLRKTEIMVRVQFKLILTIFYVFDNNSLIMRVSIKSYQTGLKSKSFIIYFIIMEFLFNNYFYLLPHLYFLSSQKTKLLYSLLSYLKNPTFLFPSNSPEGFKS
jgi:hypothetical protein